MFVLFSPHRFDYKMHTEEMLKEVCNGHTYSQHLDSDNLYLLSQVNIHPIMFWVHCNISLRYEYTLSPNTSACRP